MGIGVRFPDARFSLSQGTFGASDEMQDYRLENKTIRQFGMTDT